MVGGANTRLAGLTRRLARVAVSQSRSIEFHNKVFWLLFLATLAERNS